MSNQQGFRSLSTFKKELHRLKSLFATVPIIPLNLAIIVSLISSLKNSGLDPELIINEIKRKHSSQLLGL